MNKTLQRIVELRNELKESEAEIIPVIEAFFKKTGLFYNEIEHFAICEDYISVDYRIDGRWGGEDYHEYFQIPTAYFDAENKDKFIENLLDQQKKEKEEKESEEITKVKEAVERKERAEYEKLKKKYEPLT